MLLHQPAGGFFEGAVTRGALRIILGQMALQCLYYFALSDAKGDAHAEQYMMVEVKRTDVSADALPAQRFQWYSVYSPRVGQTAFSRHYICTPLRFLAQGKTVDGEAYRMLGNAGRTLLICFDDTKMRVLRSDDTMLCFDRKAPDTLPPAVLKAITRSL